MNNKFNVKGAVLSCLLICSVGSSAYATGTETLSTGKEMPLTHNWLDGHKSQISDESRASVCIRNLATFGPLR